MTNLMQYEKGYSPCAIQRKYGLTYDQGYELAERLKKTQELELENAQLKELLKECIPYVDRYVAFSVVQGNKEREVKSKELLDKIDEALR